MKSRGVDPASVRSDDHSKTRSDLGMKREVTVWITSLLILVALRSSVPLALRIFDPVPSDVMPGEFLGLGPPWFYLALSVNALATASFVVAVAIRACVLAIDLWRNSKADFSR